MLEEIKQFSIDYFGFNIWEKTRKREYADRRAMVYYAIDKYLYDKYSQSIVTKALQNAEHCTYIHSVKKTKILLKTDNRFANIYFKFEKLFYKNFVYSYKPKIDLTLEEENIKLRSLVNSMRGYIRHYQMRLKKQEVLSENLF